MRNDKCPGQSFSWEKKNKVSNADNRDSKNVLPIAATDCEAYVQEMLESAFS